MMTFHESDTDKILLDHGSGGIAANRLVKEKITGKLSDEMPSSMEDCAVLDFPTGCCLAFSTDSYVVDPLFFPGGDIGSLAVHGTINDLAMRGAEPLCLSLALIIEEGFPISELERIIRSIASASQESGVPVVTGDTKVVPRGGCDKIFINTSGTGIIRGKCLISSGNARPGDAILVSGTCGDHGITVMTCREGISVSGDICSDTAPLHKMVEKLLRELSEGSIHVMRDPTRGGTATALNEIAEDSGVSMEIEEAAIPLKESVVAACEILGLDPLYLANEGKMLVFVAQEDAEEALRIIRSFPCGKDAAIIGKVTAREKNGRVTLKTSVGGSRIMAALHGNPLPRIC